MKNKIKFTFIDLFAGIGGFHQALKKCGGKCVLASEINENCTIVYKNNFHQTKIVGDINENWNKLPKFDVLCGGFPCQPFSKAGNQKGFGDENRGNLFYRIIEILKLHEECKILLLENVRNLADKTENWEIIQEQLRSINFFVTNKPIILSPCQFGIPQLRERVYILGLRKDFINEEKFNGDSINIENLLPKSQLKSSRKSGSMKDAFSILDKEVDDKYYLSDEEQEILNIWDEFRKGTISEKPEAPVWLHYFGYGLKEEEFYKQKDHRGVFFKDMPIWKQKFVKANREFYKRHIDFIDNWIKKHDMINKKLLYKKFEWNCGSDCSSLKETIIQFRQSGIRAKRPTYFPALVAINNTPIVFDNNKLLFRKITPKETAKLQSFDNNFKLDGNDEISYKQLGNSVNVYIIELLMKSLIMLSRFDEMSKIR
ncbi:MAG: DNA cytosine methyltransferase [Acholeplasmatales bacterium]|jgi:DNA (cytosine-5)-methyltransferase 1|nr:DNA cytosine methyltransferase [Acholeplasmatales bacterium]